MCLPKQIICYYPSGNPKYAKLITPTWIDGKKENFEEHLGTIVDKEKGIFRSRKRGLFKFTLEDGYTSLDEPIPDVTECVKEKLMLDFGDVFVVHSVLVEMGLWNLIHDLVPEEGDTLCALTLYRFLRGHSLSNAIHWYNSSYARVLCPNATMESQRISEFYERICEAK
jgi:hypothetical protein